MPMAISPERPRTGITRLTGGRLVRGNKLVEDDLWISQEVFYEHHAVPDEIVDLKGKILCPGFIDVQFNGAFGFDFSTVPEEIGEYQKGLKRLNKHLIRTGVTSYLPTLPSQQAEVYHKVLRYLGPSGDARNALEGSESLGAHCEGPFISPSKNGIHSPQVLQEAPNGFADMETIYGLENLSHAGGYPHGQIHSPISMITAAPEVAGITACIPEVVKRGIRFAIGHTEATYEEASDAIQQGANMITHLFNAMRPLHHRNPGIFGVLGKAEGTDRPYYGIISDGIHLHPTTVKIAWNAHPDGFILVTDAMKTVGLPDGVYDWTNGDRWVKKGPLLTREGSDTLAGSSATLIECVNNFWTWSHASIPEVIRSVTETPAEMLGLRGAKGSLDADTDADLLVLDPVEEADGKRSFKIEKVWKFGTLVHDAGDQNFGL
ncbi:N-acetyl-glucosamine-6-phosphate deacetylase [Recurvomyces mirabilis]|uniref:N-acetylglucosamine-6-phosphate deacetylase n=1 Tax=Recurvomyces mirabilis TaxID=574656 RepID=A0AAE0WVZ3_9PEZI|nr:N-acetyl-glucosamine-6-phosphate deacetylase [Recurvomyces mirabilis]KAK5158883.1 N-acetyl-glucosamine-6-phosphate deacetylase [Recurvomyces mirabilis]